MGGHQGVVPRRGEVLRRNVLAPNVWGTVISSRKSMEKFPEGEMKQTTFCAVEINSVKLRDKSPYWGTGDIVRRHYAQKDYRANIYI